MKTQRIALRRDPFARATMYRETVPPSDRKPCLWCGREGRFRYAWVADGSSATWDPFLWSRIYCGIGCHDTYEGM